MVDNDSRQNAAPRPGSVSTAAVFAFLAIAGAVLIAVAVAVAATVALIGKPGASPEHRVAPTSRGIVVLVLDVSQSMAATDVSPSRLEAAKVAVTRFAERLNPRLSLGLIAFAGTASVLVSPTTNHGATKRAVSKLQLADRTATGEAIFTGLQAIATLGAVIDDGPGPPPAWMVLLSGSKETVPSNPDNPKGAYTAARTARDKGVPITTIALGTPNGYVEINSQRQPVPVDNSMLREIAGISGGGACTAATTGELNAAYDSVIAKIG